MHHLAKNKHKNKIMTYSNTLALGRKHAYSNRNQNAISFRTNQRRIGPISNTIILVVLACLLGLLYLTQVTKTNAYGYQINGLQQQQTQLKQENDNLEVTSAELQAVNRVQASQISASLTPIAPSGSLQN
jgi:hypothetical protein